jgi:hypothetical protein
LQVDREWPATSGLAVQVIFNSLIGLLDLRLEPRTRAINAALSIAQLDSI